jgi:hypothetical protein
MVKRNYQNIHDNLVFPAPAAVPTADALLMMLYYSSEQQM